MELEIPAEPAGEAGGPLDGGGEAAAHGGEAAGRPRSPRLPGPQAQGGDLAGAGPGAGRDREDQTTVYTRVTYLVTISTVFGRS